jgi:hypothetical protein
MRSILLPKALKEEQRKPVDPVEDLDSKSDQRILLDSGRQILPNAYRDAQRGTGKKETSIQMENLFHLCPPLPLFSGL